MESLRKLIYLAIAFLLVSCAQQRTPSGGDRDVTPPEIVFASPEPMSTGFTAQRIEIEFDEFVQLKGVRDQVLISPPLSKAPEITLRGGKRVIIDFGDEILRDNTTYTINFGEAIKDNNEGNILMENVFLFSTGDYIDTLSMQGQLLRARYNTPCIGCLAMLFPNLPDSVVLEDRPYYVARSDAEGDFLISNLAPGEYRLFALEDLDADLRIDANETMAFYDGLVSPSPADSSNRHLRLFSPSQEFVGIKDRDWSDDARSLILVTVGLDSIPKLQQSVVGRLEYVEQLHQRNDSLRYWFDSSMEDLDELVLDLDGILDTISVGRNKDERAIIPQTVLADIAHLEAPLTLYLERPYARIDTGLIRIEKDSLAIEWSVDSSMNSRMKIMIDAEWGEGEFYTLTILPGAIQDIFGVQNDSLLTIVRCPEDRTFGILTLDLNFPESGDSMHVELLNKSNVILQSCVVQESQKWTLPYLRPADYFLRVYVDQNGDGAWTTGDFQSNQQPEPVYMRTEPISVRANWEMEQEIVVTFD